MEDKITHAGQVDRNFHGSSKTLKHIGTVSKSGHEAIGMKGMCQSQTS